MPGSTSIKSSSSPVAKLFCSNCAARSSAISACADSRLISGIDSVVGTGWARALGSPASIWSIMRVMASSSLAACCRAPLRTSMPSSPISLRNASDCSNVVCGARFGMPMSARRSTRSSWLWRYFSTQSTAGSSRLPIKLDRPPAALIRGSSKSIKEPLRKSPIWACSSGLSSFHLRPPRISCICLSVSDPVSTDWRYCISWFKVDRVSSPKNSSSSSPPIKSNHSCGARPSSAKDSSGYNEAYSSSSKPISSNSGAASISMISSIDLPVRLLYKALSGSCCSHHILLKVLGIFSSIFRISIAIMGLLVRLA